MSRSARVERMERGVVAVVVVPQFRRDEHFSTWNATLAHAFADVLLVAVDTCGVDVSIADAERREYHVARDGAARRLPHTEPDLRSAG